MLKDMLHLSNVIEVKEEELDKNSRIFIFKNGKISLSHEQDAIERKASLVKKLEHLEAEISRSKKMLDNENFLLKAPAQLVEKEKVKLIENEKIKADILKDLAKFN